MSRTHRADTARRSGNRRRAAAERFLSVAQDVPNATVRSCGHCGGPQVFKRSLDPRTVTALCQACNLTYSIDRHAA